MKPSLRRAVVAVLTIGASALGGSGCADSESMLFVRQVQKPALSGTTCTVDSTTSSDTIPSGLLDVAFRLQYTASLLVGNQLVPRGNSSQLRTETSRIAIQGSVVRVQDSNGVVRWGPVTVPGSGFIDPASGTNPSFGVTDTILLGSELGAQLAADPQVQMGLVRHLTSVVKVFGRTLGGLNVDSGEFDFPLTVCYRCLIQFPPDAQDPRAAVIPNCNLAPATGTTLTPPCQFGQDDNIDCRICKQNLPGSALCDPTH
jgi:hypothetical protein